MAEKYKYVNVSGAPIYVPGKRGVTVLFRPGEGTVDPWYSRFCGPRQLTKVPIQNKPSEGFPPIPATQSLQQKIDIPIKVEEETSQYVKKVGIYYCKLCDLFRTGSIRAFEIHLKQYHKLDETRKTVDIKDRVPKRVVEQVAGGEEILVSTKPVTKKIEEGEKVVVDTSDLPKKETDVTVAKQSSQLTEEKTEVVEGHLCVKCGKQFGSERGLKSHITRTHSGG